MNVSLGLPQILAVVVPALGVAIGLIMHPDHWVPAQPNRATAASILLGMYGRRFSPP